MNGEVAVSGTAYGISGDGEAGTFVARLVSGGAEPVITRVWPYCPQLVTVTEDGVIWTIGWVLNERGFISMGNALRRYGKHGEELSTTAVAAESVFSRDAVTYSALRTSGGRVGWFTNANVYIEFALDGREVYRIAGPRPPEGHQFYTRTLAMSPSGEVVTSVRTNEGALHVWELIRRVGIWRELSVDKEVLKPIGFDGQNLVMQLASLGREIGKYVRR